MTKALTDKPLFETTLEERRYPADLTSTLLTMWALPELTAWYQERNGKAKDVTSSIVTPTRIITPKRALVDATARGMEPIGDVLSRNGVHKPR